MDMIKSDSFVRCASSVVRRAALAAVLGMALACTDMWAADLPVKTVNGRQFYCYTVHRLDNIYGVADVLGVTKEDILKYNPSATDGLRAGDVLYFPADVFAGKFGDASATEVVPQGAPVSGGSTTRYVVQRDETLFGISRKFNVEPEAIIALNPQADFGISTGDVLLIPDGDAAVQAAKEAREAVAARNARNNAYTDVNEIHISDVSSSDARNAALAADSLMHPAIDGARESADVAGDISARQYNVVVMLPFMLSGEASHAAAQITDFYKGLLVAADTLSATAPRVHITAIDTENSLLNVRDRLANDSRIAGADVIVAPDNLDQLGYIADFGRDHNIYVINAVNARDDSYKLNPYVLQGLIPSQLMLEKACAGFVDCLDGATPVILRNQNGRDDKSAFVDMVITRLRSEGHQPLEVVYDGALTVSELEERLGDGTAQQRYVFLPLSGTLSEFNKFSAAVVRFGKAIAENGGDSRVFGYPEWTTFRNDAERALHDMKATIYTRSYVSLDDSDARGVNDAFVRWFGTRMSEGVPVQGLMGYDLGCYLFKALAANALGDENGVHDDYRGVQSAYQFRHDDDGLGAVNTALYFVDFLPGDAVDVRVK